MRKVIMAVLLLMLSSCATPLLQSNFTVREPYQNPGHLILTDGSSVALFTASDGEREHEERKLLGSFVEDAIKTRSPNVKVVSYWQSLSTINSEGYNVEYGDMIKEYTRTGILAKETLGRMGKLLGVKYVLQPRLIDFSQSQSSRFSLLGLSLFKTHESQIKLYLEVWEAETGKIVWIGTAEANMASENYKARPIPFELIARYAATSLIQKMP